MEEEKAKIICTIGPSSNRPEILEKLANRGVNFFRINLSHTEEENIEQRIKELQGYGIPIILDTEGSQVRSGNTKSIYFEEGKDVLLHNKKVECDSGNIFLNPIGIFSKLSEGDLISIDFNSVLLRVYDTIKKEEGLLRCRIVISGEIGGKKAVQIQSQGFRLPTFSKKDHLAISLGKKHGVNHFSLSFIESPDSVKKFREICPEAIIYSKIESKKGLDNFLEIAQVSEGVLIDRGDLSLQVQLEKIPFIQKFISKKVRALGKEVFIATNTLEQMAFALKPNKAEVNDIVNILLDGATGIALTKETAVGKYPVEVVNEIQAIINQINFINKDGGDDLIQKLEKTNYIYSEENPELLVKPHGGKLVNRLGGNYSGKIPENKIEISEESLMDAEQISVGAFSPLEGFMKSEDFYSVVNNMRLSNGIIWPLPIVLDVNASKSAELEEGKDVSLSYNEEVYAILHLEEIYQVNKEIEAMKIYGTNDKNHPGVSKFLSLGDYFLGGKITLLKRRNSPFKVHELAPMQTRKLFSERGWSKVVGFHTRNIIHKSHEFIQLEGMRRGLCDGLFVHLIIGKKKHGDFEADVIIKSYEKMIESFYTDSKVIMGTFATYSRYCGPREALFTALCRKNFGCSHFIIGRDHTGVGNFYGPYDSHKIFDNFSEEELGIIAIKFDKVFYSDLENKHIHEPEFIDHPEENKIQISGMQAREMFLQGKNPPEWFMRPEISKIILDKLKSGEKVFVE